jgi:hypothetical protein
MSLQVQQIEGNRYSFTVDSKPDIDLMALAIKELKHQNLLNGHTNSELDEDKCFQLTQHLNGTRQFQILIALACAGTSGLMDTELCEKLKFVKKQQLTGALSHILKPAQRLGLASGDIYTSTEYKEDGHLRHCYRLTSRFLAFIEKYKLAKHES